MTSAILTTYQRELAVRIRLKIRRILSMGLKGMTVGALKKSLTFALAVVLLPVSLVLYALGIRRLCIFTDRIGHLAIEPDTMLKGQVLGLIEKKRWFVLAPPNRVANDHLLQYWAEHFTIFTSPFACFVMYALSVLPFMRYKTSHLINNFHGPQVAYEAYRLWGDRPPLLTLTAEDESYAASALATLGVPPGAWFVCIHAREGGFSPLDEPIHSHRNGDINNLMAASQRIVEQGGWVIRLGDPSSKPMPAMHGVIDYAHHILRSARLDIILCAKARFILGNTSGIFLVGTVFGTPNVLANMVPMSALGFTEFDISMPKLHRHIDTNEYMTFTDVMNSEVSNCRYASLYKQYGVIVEENSADDILAITNEMLDRLNGTLKESEDDVILHAKYMSLFKSTHYSYGSPAKVSTAFLRNHQEIM